MKNSYSPDLKFFPVSAVTVLCLVFLIALFWRGIFGHSEGRYAEIPRGMAAESNWTEMRLMGVRYYEKPPLAYWSIAPSIKIFGASEQAARLPLLINAGALLFILFLAAKRVWPAHDTKRAMFVTVSSTGFIMGFAMLMTDPFLTFWFTVTCLTAFFAFQPESTARRRLLLLLLAGFSAAMGFLAKGAIAVVLPGAIIFLWLIFERRLKELFRPTILPAIALFFAILVPALLFIEKHNPGFFYHFVVEEHFARFLGTRDKQLHSEPFYYFLVMTPVLMLPWTFFAVRAVRNIKRHGLRNLDPFSKYLIIWAAVVILFFSIGTGKLIGYVLPALAPLMMLLGKWGFSVPFEGTGADKKLWKAGYVSVFLPVIVLAVLWALSGDAGRLPIGRNDSYRASLISLTSFLPFFLFLILVRRTKKFYTFHGVLTIVSSILLTAALLLSPFPGKDFNALLHRNSSYVYKALADRLKPEDEVVMLWRYRPDCAFYIQRNYIIFKDRNELNYGMKLEPEKSDIQTRGKLLQRLSRVDGKIYAVVHPNDLDDRFAELAIPYAETDLPSDPLTVIFELHPEN